MADGTVVKHRSGTGFTCAEHSGSRILRDSMMTDLGLSARVRVCGLTPTQPNRLLREEDLERPDILN